LTPGKQQSLRCCYCSCERNLATAQPEHLVSLRNGGKNSLANLDVCCPVCNSRKGGKNWNEFIVWLLEHDEDVDIDRFLAITDEYAEIREAA